jgi:hypothetical protein
VEAAALGSEAMAGRWRRGHAEDLAPGLRDSRFIPAQYILVNCFTRYYAAGRGQEQG